MGAPKQKWTAEEESALKAGVKKHGQGKWRTILKDPEFSGILCLRSNVDLKDKWRNLSVTANGWGSRDKAKAGTKSCRQFSKHENSSKEVSAEIKDMDDSMVDVRPLATSVENLHVRAGKRPFLRVDKLIQEAIANLEPTGSNQTAIAMYIEERYLCPPDFTRLLSATLKELTASGRLIKAKRGWYRIAPEACLPEERQRDPPRVVSDDSRQPLRSPIDPELPWMHNTTAKEAAAATAAAQAVAEAEEAMAEAQAATEEAEALEADAEAAQAFLQAVLQTINSRSAADTDQVMLF